MARTAAAAYLRSLVQRVEDLALLARGFGRLARHAQDVGGLRAQVAQEGAGLADGHAVLPQEAFARVAHQQAVPVGVVHDAVEGVQAAGRRGPVDRGGCGRDVLHSDGHAGIE